MNEVVERPWYKQFWPWFLISLPLSAVVAGITTIIIANMTFDGLVVDDYYKQGKAINQEKGRDHMAAHLGLSARLEMDLAAGQVRLQLDSKVALPSQELQLTLLHPTRAGNDVQLALDSDGGGLYHASMAPMRGVHWNLLLAPKAGKWRLRGRYPGGQQATIRLQSEI